MKTSTELNYGDAAGSGAVSSPFDNIALTFSGGGFRAGAFALGTLSYLNHLTLEDETPLLQKVTYISSASGGTIASAMYAHHQAQGLPFGTFFKSLYINLEGETLLNTALEVLNDNSNWKNTSKSRNMINAFAIAYDQMLFEGAEAKSLEANPASHLDEVCFNTTEFYRGLLFRQAVKMKTDTKAGKDKTFLFGNYIVNLEQEAAEKLKLGDLLAASSCFPGGFEPIIFPSDFGNSNYLLSHLKVQLQELSMEELHFLYNEADVKKIQDTTPLPDCAAIVKALENVPLKADFNIGLMDGGITDNQGIESMMRANDRRVKRETAFTPFDLMLVNDVGSHYMDPYKIANTKNPLTGKVNTKRLMAIAISGMAVSVTGIVLSFFWQQPAASKWLLLASTFIFVLSSLMFTALVFLNKGKTWVKNKASNLLSKTFSAAVIAKLFHFLGHTPVGVLGNMLVQRGKSMAILNVDVFLKRVRQLLYRQFYDEAKQHYRIKSNHVYDLSFTNDINFNSNKSLLQLKPGRNIQIVAEKAYSMGTTLWFDESHESHSLAALIACGHFTTCFNLLEYTGRLIDSAIFAGLEEKYKDRLKALHLKLSDDYKILNNDPFHFYNDMGKQFGISDFKPYNVNMIPFPANFVNLRP